MGKYFDIAELSKKPQDPSELKVEKFLQSHSHSIVSLRNLSVALPAPGEIFFLWTISSFNSFTFIPYLAKHSGIIDRLIISTYSINQRIVASLMRMIDKGMIKKVFILISDSMRHRMPKVVDLLEAQITHRSGIVEVKYSWNHSKVTLMESAGRYFVVEGSGNWSENSRNEQYIFLESKSVFDFRAKWITNADR